MDAGMRSEAGGPQPLGDRSEAATGRLPPEKVGTAYMAFPKPAIRDRRRPAAMSLNRCVTVRRPSLSMSPNTIFSTTLDGLAFHPAAAGMPEPVLKKMRVRSHQAPVARSR